ncbi:fimbrial chaperone protein precursor [Escherichia coli]|nr:fimbrial chaperone protein precursor [Escherichia coli]
MQTTRTPYSISFMATVLLLLLFACHSTVANAAVALGVDWPPESPDNQYHLFK